MAISDELSLQQPGCRGEPHRDAGSFSSWKDVHDVSHRALVKQQDDILKYRLETKLFLGMTIDAQRLHDERPSTKSRSRGGVPVVQVGVFGGARKGQARGDKTHSTTKDQELQVR